MEDYNFLQLENECLLMVVTSTFGNGDSPGNGQVWDQLLPWIITSAGENHLNIFVNMYMDKPEMTVVRKNSLR